MKETLLGNDKRTRRLRVNSLFILFCKICTVLVNLLYVPLLLDAMSQANYGIWLTLSSIVSWLFVFDIGIGHGVRNKVAEAIAENRIKDAKSIVSTGYFVLSCVVLFLVLIVWCVFPLFNWANVLGAPSIMNEELTILTIIAVSCFCLQLLLKLIDAILYAFQSPALVSAIVLLHQVLGMLIIYVMKYNGDAYSLLDYGTVISVTPVAVMLIFSIIYFAFFNKQMAPSFRYVSKKYIKDVLGLGVRFFAIQLTAVLLFQTNSIIVAHEIDPSAVVDYNIAYKYFGVLLMVFTTITTPLWSAATEAFVKNDLGWIRKTYKNLNKIYISSVIIGVIMLVVSPWVYQIWLHQAISINWLLMCLMFLYYILNIRTSIYTSFINGAGKISLQLYMTAFECMIHIPLAIVLCKYIGICGVIVSLIIVTIINLVWEPIQFKKLCSGTDSGIWNK